MKKYFMLLAAAVMTVVACGSKNQECEQTDTKKCLVLYYSQTGATKAVAEELQKALGCDIEAVDVEVPYDGDFGATIQRWQKEQQNGELPKLKPLKADLGSYDVIFIGYPIWGGTYASPITALLKEQAFEGKTIVPFCTFGSGGLETGINDLKAALPKAEIVEGYGVRNARIAAIPAEVNRFLIENGYIDGEVEALPEYSEQQPVTKEETAIFNAACGDYQFPLGTPATVGKRETANSTDYKYTVNSKGMTGEDVTSTIYVTVGNAENAKPEFTRVVR